MNAFYVYVGTLLKCFIFYTVYVVLKSNLYVARDTGRGKGKHRNVWKGMLALDQGGWFRLGWFQRGMICVKYLKVYRENVDIYYLYK